MPRTHLLTASSLYFAIVFAVGFLLGTLRVLALEPEVGHSTAVLFELPFMLAASFFACHFVVTRLNVPLRLGPRLFMGSLAFIFLIMAEITLSMLMSGAPLDAALSQLLAPENRIGLGGQALFGAMPTLILATGYRLSD